MQQLHFSNDRTKGAKRLTAASEPLILGGLFAVFLFAKLLP